jgi:hypothetical protein
VAAIAGWKGKRGAVADWIAAACTRSFFLRDYPF